MPSSTLLLLVITLFLLSAASCGTFSIAENLYEEIIFIPFDNSGIINNVFEDYNANLKIQSFKSVNGDYELRGTFPMPKPGIVIMPDRENTEKTLMDVVATEFVFFSTSGIKISDVGDQVIAILEKFSPPETEQASILNVLNESGAFNNDNASKLISPLKTHKFLLSDCEVNLDSFNKSPQDPLWKKGTTSFYASIPLSVTFAEFEELVETMFIEQITLWSNNETTPESVQKKIDNILTAFDASKNTYSQERGEVEDSSNYNNFASILKTTFNNELGLGAALFYGARSVMSSSDENVSYAIDGLSTKFKEFGHTREGFAKAVTHINGELLALVFSEHNKNFGNETAKWVMDVPYRQYAIDLVDLLNTEIENANYNDVALNSVYLERIKLIQKYGGLRSPAYYVIKDKLDNIAYDIALEFYDANIDTLLGLYTNSDFKIILDYVYRLNMMERSVPFDDKLYESESQSILAFNERLLI